MRVGGQREMHIEIDSREDRETGTREGRREGGREVGRKGHALTFSYKLRRAK